MAIRHTQYEPHFQARRMIESCISTMHNTEKRCRWNVDLLLFHMSNMSAEDQGYATRTIRCLDAERNGKIIPFANGIPDVETWNIYQDRKMKALNDWWLTVPEEDKIRYQKKGNRYAKTQTLEK